MGTEGNREVGRDDRPKHTTYMYESGEEWNLLINKWISHEGSLTLRRVQDCCFLQVLLKDTNPTWMETHDLLSSPEPTSQYSEYLGIRFYMDFERYPILKPWT